MWVVWGPYSGPIARYEPRYDIGSRCSRRRDHHGPSIRTGGVSKRQSATQRPGWSRLLDRDRFSRRDHAL